MRALSVVFGAFAWAIVACVAQPTAPHLLQVAGVEPRELYIGEELRLNGTDFPVGQPALVRLEGTVFTAGAPARDVRLELSGSVAEASQLTVRLEPQHQPRLWGRDGRPRHASFRGAVVVEFDARRDDAPSVTGRLEDVQIELYPAADSQSSLSEQAREAARTLAFVGIWGLAPTGSPSGGLTLQRLDPLGLASRAGLQVGDSILQLDEVAAISSREFLLRQDQQTLRLLVRRSGHASRLEFELDVQDLSSAPPPALGLATAAGFAGALLLFTGFGWGGRFSIWFFSHRRHLRAGGEPAAPSLRGGGFGLWDAACLLIPGLWASSFAFGVLQRPTVSLLTVLLLSWVSTLLAACWDGGRMVLDSGLASLQTRRPHQFATSWSLRGGLAAGFAHLKLTLPGALLLAGVALSRFDSGLIPPGARAYQVSTWLLWQGPLETGAALAIALWALPTHVGRPWEALLPRARERTRTMRAYACCQAFAESMVLLVIAALLLGGWQMAGGEVSTGERWLGMLAFWLKWLALVAMTRAVKRWFTVTTSSVLGGPSLMELSTLTNRYWGMILAAVTLGLGAFAFGPTPFGWLLAKTWCSLLALGAGLIVMLLAVSSRDLEQRRLGTRRLDVNPWL